MVITILVVLGLAFGSFINALVWRLHEQQATTKIKKDKKYSIFNGRSMCPNCGHELAAVDLIPLVSWLMLKGKCRYCQKPISVQYPLVELATAVLFVVSYVWWPSNFGGNLHHATSSNRLIFVLWLIILIGLIALFVYDLRWMLLPNRIIYPLTGLATIAAVIIVATSASPSSAILNEVLAVAVGGGIFYVLFQISNGKWIGGGDVKLGWMLGLIAGTPARSFLLIFIATLLGSLVSLPLLALHRLKRNSTVPFGPFLIIAVVVVQLFGHAILHWYQNLFVL